jgi:hypothetical protein
MGLGDALMASAQVRVANELTGKRIALGDGRKLRWGKPEMEVFQGNERLYHPGHPINNSAARWLRNYSGSRPYIDRERMEREFEGVFPGKPFTTKVSDARLPWRYTDWEARTNGPGELYLTDKELEWGKAQLPAMPTIIIEPGTKPGASPNKNWGWDKYAEVSDGLSKLMEVRQFNAQALLPGAESITTSSFRQACSVLAASRIYLGAEGGLHHAAAALGVPAVVYYGGMHKSSMTGYDSQEFLEREGEPCGQRVICQHCIEIANDISPAEAFAAIGRITNG